MHTMARRALEAMRGYRRALHQIPELGLEEFKTQEYILRQLAPLSPDALHKIADTGVKCVFRGTKEGRTLGFRADMDALAIQEKTGVSFQSRHEGKMHACGHDGHMAALLGLALCVAALRDAGELAGSVTLLFQPAEESVGGAERMIQSGAMENPPIDEIYGLHLSPDQPIGQVSCCAGPMMASDYEFDIHITGRAAHGAMPHKGVNALDAANALYARLKALAQLCDPAELALLNIGRMQGGEQRNVVPDTAVLQCLSRTFSEDVLYDLREKIRIAAEGTARAYDVVIALSDRVYYPPVVNPPDMVRRLDRQLGGISPQKPLLIAEDFSFYQRERPGLFFYVGICEEGYASPLHTESFNFDERALGYALSAYLNILFDRMRP